MENSPPDSPLRSPIRSSAPVLSPPRPRNRKHARRNAGGKVVIRLDDYNQPLSPREDVLDLSGLACELARREIPIIYGDFRDVPATYYENIIEGLNEHYVFENCEEDGVDCEYIREKVKDAWRNFKSKLKRKRVDGKDPAVVKLEDAPKGHPVEDWRVFVDNCNTEEMQKSSLQNSENRGSCKLPNCSGRIPAQVVRHEIAKQKGIPDSQVGLGTMYREMHTKKKDKALQNAEAIDIGDGSMGRRRAMGAGVTNYVAKKMAPILKKRATEEENSKVWKNKIEGKIDGLTSAVSQFIKSVDVNHIQSPSRPLSGHQYDVGDTSVNFTQRPPMSSSGQQQFFGTSPANNIRRTSVPPSKHVDASVTARIPRRAHENDGDSSPNNNTPRTARPPSGYSREANASVTTPTLLRAHHTDGGSSSMNNPGGQYTHMYGPGLGNRNEGKKLQAKSLLSSIKASTGTISGQEGFFSPSPSRGSKAIPSTQRSTPSPSLGSKAMAAKQSSTPSNNEPLFDAECGSSLVNNSKKPLVLSSGPRPDVGAVMTNLKKPPKIVTCDARQLIGIRVKVRGGWPSKVVALGVIKAVDPRTEFEGRKLGIGYYLIYVDSVQCPNFELPVPHGQWTTLGQLGAGYVIWPKDDIKLMEHS